MFKKQPTYHANSSQATAGNGTVEGRKLQQLLLAFALTIFFTSPFQFLQASEGTIAPPGTALVTSTTLAPNNVQGGGDSGDPETTPCSSEAVSLHDVLTVTKGVSAFAAAESGSTTEVSPSILVVVLDRSGNEAYSKIQVTGRKGNALVVSDCLKRLSPGTYTIIATSKEYMKHKTIFVPTL